jgi:Flp pilus assembly pilin Flp
VVRPLKEKRSKEKNVSTMEYTVMLVLVAIAVAIATPELSGTVKSVFWKVNGILNAAP